MTASLGARTVRAASLPVLALVAVLGSAQPAQAATFHVRADGGDTSQCTGRADAAYPGSGSQQACAWKHPFMALPPGGPARIAGGDTLLIAAGSYMMGLGAPGASGCHQSWSWECHMTAIPSGPSPTQPTRILGQGHASGCTAAPQLWGTERASLVVNLQGSSNVEVACLELTDRHSCIEHHCHGGNCGGEINRCNRDSVPYGTWAGNGIKASDSNNVLLRDLNIHGLANRGVLAGRLSNWTMERMTIRGNPWAGWDGDIGANSSNSGHIVFRQLELAWNGCGERYPSGEPFGCWGQTAGGYGDGLGTGATGGHWVFEDSLIHHNTSDGLDLLYMQDGASVTVRRTWVEGNAGNQLKTKGTALIENSVIVGNCAFFQNHGNMHPGDNCRALGNALSVALANNSIATVVNNTITSEGDCLILSSGGGSSAQLNISNNLLLGDVDWRQPWERSCAHYADASSAQVNWSRNFVTGVKNGACPGDSLCVGLPLITNPIPGVFDPLPMTGSPLINAANAAQAPATDFRGYARSIPDIGAYEYGASPGGGTSPDVVLRDGFD